MQDLMRPSCGPSTASATTYLVPRWEKSLKAKPSGMSDGALTEASTATMHSDGSSRRPHPMPADFSREA